MHQCLLLVILQSKNDTQVNKYAQKSFKTTKTVNNTSVRKILKLSALFIYLFIYLLRLYSTSAEGL